ncbi:MAG TPA: hypothetical protein VHG28_08645 [Longimicrobiaceae bacterium]|nr:hypothetical protein [Longimicrobiaceae bacterium]
MAKLECDCGHLIHDGTDFLPHKADLYPDQDFDRVWTEPVDAAVAFLRLPEGERAGWLRSYFGAGAPREVRVEDVLAHILERGRSAARLEVLECEQCGKLWVQLGPREYGFQGYTPDPQNRRGILRSAASPA